MPSEQPVTVSRKGPITIVQIDRPHARNAVDGAAARALAQAFIDFDADETASVAILSGTSGTFCAGGARDGFGEPGAAEGNRVIGRRNHCAGDFEVSAGMHAP